MISHSVIARVICIHSGTEMKMIDFSPMIEVA